MAKATGRKPGQSNFKLEEDKALAVSYVAISTDAAVGTDQSRDSFWTRVHANFVSFLSASDRNSTSLQNRWNNTLNKEVGKYVGHLSSALRVYHSGWQLQDYFAEAKRQYHIKEGARFKHEEVYLILKKLPKYAVAMDQIDCTVSRALALDENEGDDNGQLSLNVAPRPEVGNKKAKQLKTTPQKHGSSEKETTLQRLAAASEAKNKLLKDSMVMRIFERNPESEEAKTYFKMMQKQALNDLGIDINDENLDQ
ncbi:hypothetical protein AC1031_020644 [Aphanomyces cochlioides]|nr:hypothetical protein AC1031_020644 [Aphanomyces cochlioides]